MATRSRASCLGPQGAHRPDPQADRHVRSGGQPVLELPRAARRADAAAALARRVGQRGSRSPRFLEADPSGRVGPLPGPRLAPGPRRRDAACSATRVRRDGHVQAARRRRRDGRVHGPPAPVRHRRQPGRHPHARLSAAEGRRDHPGVVGCEDIEDLLEDFAPRAVLRRGRRRRASAPRPPRPSPAAAAA